MEDHKKILERLITVVEDEIVKNRRFPALFRNRMKFGIVVGMVLEIKKYPEGTNLDLN